MEDLAVDTGMAANIGLMLLLFVHHHMKVLDTVIARGNTDRRF
jgi:hypothetical protein